MESSEPASVGLHHPSVPSGSMLRLFGRRVLLRPLVAADFAQWSEVRVRNERATWRFGASDDPPSFPPTTMEKERSDFKRWALSEQGILDNITMPVLMINGKLDHLAPIGNIYFMLETGPATGKEARVYADAGHCAFKYQSHWAPATFRWLAEKLNR